MSGRMVHVWKRKIQNFPGRGCAGQWIAAIEMPVIPLAIVGEQGRRAQPRVVADLANPLLKIRLGFRRLEGDTHSIGKGAGIAVGRILFDRCRSKPECHRQAIDTFTR